MALPDGSSMGWPWLVCFEGMIRTDKLGPIGRIWAEHEGKNQYLKVGKSGKIFKGYKITRFLGVCP